MDNTCRGEGEGLNCKTRRQRSHELKDPGKVALHLQPIAVNWFLARKQAVRHQRLKKDA